MPSPIVHSLAGLTVGNLAARRRSMLAGQAPLVAALLLAGNAPDLDFIPGILIGDAGRFHHGPVHSLFAGAVFALLVLPLAHRAGFQSVARFGLLMWLAFVSHLLLDMMSTDHGIRNGVPLFWPLSEESLSFPFAIFIDIKRDLRARGFVHSLLLWHNVYSVLWELCLLSGVMGLVQITRLARSRIREFGSGGA